MSDQTFILITAALNFGGAVLPSVFAWLRRREAVRRLAERMNRT